MARSFFKKESMTIGFILPDITSPFFSAVFLETEKHALKKGYTMILCNSMNSLQLEYTHLKTLSEKRVDAIVFMGGRVNQVKTNKKYAEEMNSIAKKIPIIIVNGKMTGVDCYKVITDEEKGIFELVEYLISLGHKKFGLIGGIPGVTSTYIKNKAFKNALKKYELAINENWIIKGDFSIESGIKCMQKLMQNKQKPTALLAINDFVAIGAIKQANSIGLKVPQDISITGFDGSFISEVISPMLTTVSQNYKTMGKTIVDTVINVIKKKETKKKKIVETKLIIRESSCEVNIE